MQGRYEEESHRGSLQAAWYLCFLTKQMFGCCFFLNSLNSQKGLFLTSLKKQSKILHLQTQILTGSNPHLLCLLTLHQAHPPAGIRAPLCPSPPLPGFSSLSSCSRLFAAWPWRHLILQPLAYKAVEVHSSSQYDLKGS